MKKLIILLSIITTFSCLKAQNNNEDDKKITTTTYYIVRHAEKDNKPANNPKLLPEGKLRALNYAKYFKNIKLDAIYSTDFTRTKNTALPTAKSKNLKTIIYNAFEIDYNKFKDETKGKTIFIVGHSNTISDFANNIIGTKEYNEIDETVYNNMYIVTITDKKINHQLKTID
ncbi:MAG: phosphoglycerate mutase family protein [Lacinutrix venerupis]